MDDVKERPTRQQVVGQPTSRKTRRVRNVHQAKARGKAKKSQPGTPASDSLVNELMIRRIMAALMWEE